MAAVASIPFVWFVHMQYSIPTGLLLPPLPLLVCCWLLRLLPSAGVWCVNEEFSGWSGRLNAENVECYCCQLPGSGSRRQASEQASKHAANGLRYCRSMISISAAALHFVDVNTRREQQHHIVDLGSSGTDNGALAGPPKTWCFIHSVCLVSLVA